MKDIAELVRRTERLQDHVEAIRAELAELRKDLDRIQATPTTNGPAMGRQGKNCLRAALERAEDLGPEFSSDDPHRLAGRGDDWFDEP
jgi:hypothetical protein